MKNRVAGRLARDTFRKKARSSRRVRPNIKGYKKAFWKSTFFPVDSIAREAERRRKDVGKYAARSIPIKEMAM